MADDMRRLKPVVLIFCFCIQMSGSNLAATQCVSLFVLLVGVATVLLADRRHLKLNLKELQG